jgi:hypothetical protein
LTLLQLGGQTVSDLTTATNTFFANTYGLASGTIDIGNDIFGLIGTNTHYIVGTVSDGATLNETGGQDVIHGGAGDDTIVGVGHPTSGSDNVVVSVVDGGGGDNNLDYSSATDNLNVTMDDSGAFDYRLVIDKGPTDDPSATDYAVNIQTLDLGSGDDTFTAPAEFPTGSGTIMIDGGGGTNTLDFSDYSGSITFANGDVSSGPNFNNFQRLIGSARADTFNLEDDGSDAGSSAIQMIDGGNGSDTFNINNNGVSSPLLLEGGNGDDTFYVNNPNSGQYTVIWGGDGADTYDFTTQEVLNPFDVVAVDMEGLNQTTFEHLDVNALEADLDNIYGADPNRIVILNPDSQDQLQFWEMTAGSPQSNVSGFTDYYWGSDHQHVDGYELSANGLQMSPGLAYSDTSVDPTGRVLDIQAEQSYPLTTTVDFGPDGSVVNTTNYLYIDGIHLFGFAQGQFGITLTDGPSDDGPNPGNLIPQDFFNSAYDPPAFQASNYQLT